MTERPLYEFLVDWDGDGGHALGEFEAGLDGWVGRPLPPVPPDPPEPTPAFVRAVASATSTTTAFTVSAPAGAVAGDVLVLIQTSNLGTASALAAPSGGGTWAQLGSTITGGTDALHTKVWWKRATASEPATYGLTQASGAASVVSVTAVGNAHASAVPTVVAYDPMVGDVRIPTPSAVPAFGDDLELRWVGAQYTTPPPQTVTRTYPATWTASWYGYGKRSGSRAYQGDTQLGDGTGTQYSKIGFNDSAIRADLAGATIDRVEARLTNEHAWFNSGLTARIGTHNNSSEPSGSASVDGTFSRSSHAWTKGQAKYVTLSDAIGAELRDGTARGLTLGRPTTGSRNDYGYFRGYDAGGAHRPLLRITYTTGGAPATISFGRPSALFAERADLSAASLVGGALVSRQLRDGDPTGQHALTAAEEPARTHGLTVLVASVQPVPDPGDPDLSPTLEASTDRAHSGTGSLLATWTEGSPDQRAQRTLAGLHPGRTYTLSGWVWVPAGSSPVRLEVADTPAAAVSTVVDAWEQLTMEVTATATEHTVQLAPTGDTGQAYLDSVRMIGPGEDITTRVLGTRTPVDISRGRDQARNLAPTGVGQTGLELDNRSHDYTPDNPDTPLSGFLGPGRPVTIRATWQGTTYPLFTGQIDDYTLDPERGAQSVSVTALDALGRLRDATLSTRMYPSLSTGEAIHVVLDEIGWPQDKRDIDPGASVLRWWWAEGTDAFDAVSQIVEAEGPSALVMVSPFGDFVFRGRHHRLLRPRSQSVQTTLRGEGAEPLFSSPVSYDIGWKDIVNAVDVAVAEREPGRATAVWEDPGLINLAAGEVRHILVQADEPFTGARVPVIGTRVTGESTDRITPEDHDLVLRAGQVSLSLSRTSGQSTTIRLAAGPAGASILGMRLRARPVPVARTIQVRAEDTESIAQYGRRSYDGTLALAGVHDVAAIAQLILGQRSQRLPVMTITVAAGGHDERMRQVLTREVSDRIHITEPTTFSDHDYYVETITHSIRDVGFDHTASFGAERVREQHPDALTFDDPARGFGAVFGAAGIDNPTTLFILDHSSLDEGLLGH
ncbi:RHS repeat domain-containing protein [Nocardiopsis dassonvillei]|uniref:hypothetical protein n=1 Tax=Nocardiopsis dassonvillei TaxID=2014 RepID=UPI0036358694